jgi:dsRNA-specific ribonuclease
MNSDYSIKNDYNPNNCLVTKEFIEKTLSNVVGAPIRINNLHLYQTAFVHKSTYRKNLAPPNCPEPLIFYQTYESLEFVGDAWLGAIVSDYLYHRFPGQQEGFFTKVRSKIVRDSQLIKFSEYLGFDQYAILPTRIEKTTGRKGAKFLEDMFEAFCAAVIKDLGVGILQIFLKHLIELQIDFNEIILYDDDYKSILLQFYQKHGWSHPTYTMLSQEGPSHSRVFTMGLDYIPEFDHLTLEDLPIDKLPRMKHDTGVFLTVGEGKTKKDGEQEASRKALELFGMIV